MRSFRGPTILVGLLVMILAGCSDGEAEAGKRITTPTGELSIAIPRSWDYEAPTAQLRVYSGAPYIPSENCNIGRSSVIFQVSRVREGGSAFPDYPPRPRRFTSKSGTGLRENIADLGDCGALSQWIQFTQHGHRYAADVTLGRDVTLSKRAAAYRVLDSLRISN